jgi:hypothetical protein
MPEHDGQTMNVIFPFVYQPLLARGIIYYLFEYFNNMTEMSLGDIIASYQSCGMSTDEKGREVYSLVFTIALAPFDLGVTQTASCRAYYDDVVQSYRLEMKLDRISGQDRNWVTTNKPFLKKMRQLLLHWRNVDPTEQQWYGECGRRLIEEGPDALMPSEEEKRQTYMTVIRDRDSVFGAGVAMEESDQSSVISDQSEDPVTADGGTPAVSDPLVTGQGEADVLYDDEDEMDVEDQDSSGSVEAGFDDV